MPKGKLLGDIIHAYYLAAACHALQLVLGFQTVSYVCAKNGTTNKVVLLFACHTSSYKNMTVTVWKPNEYSSTLPRVPLNCPAARLAWIPGCATGETASTLCTHVRIQLVRERGGGRLAPRRATQLWHGVRHALVAAAPALAAAWDRRSASSEILPRSAAQLTRTVLAAATPIIPGSKTRHLPGSPRVYALSIRTSARRLRPRH